MNPASRRPRHLAVILDGNRRYAKKHLLQPQEGHRKGKETLINFLKWCQKYGIEELTLYAFSLQNFSRDQKEVNYLMNLFLITAEEALRSPLFNNLSVRFLGERQRLPAKVQEVMARFEKLTANNEPYLINIAFAYGGREEIVEAVKTISQEVLEKKYSPQDITMDTITQHLQLQNEPDLIIRTGGDRRTSNFLLWQSWYSEWIFLKKYWPEFTEDDFLACLEDYAQRERRYGGDANASSS